MKGRKGFTLIELLVVIAIIAILAAILFPVFARARRTAQTANCQSNMKQIGIGLKRYLTDWDDTFPVNRQRNGSVSPEVKLTLYNGSPAYDSVTGKPLRFLGPINSDGTSLNDPASGVNWVEGLYNYVDAVTNTEDAKSEWKCQAAFVGGRATQQNGTTTDCVSYTFNYNLLETSESGISSSSSLLMVREMDRYGQSVCLGQPNNGVPQHAFLSGQTNDGMTGAPSPDIKSELHAKGSNILFADGHVKTFPVTYFPANPVLSTAADDTNGKYFNAISGPTAYKIAVTP